MCIQKDKNTVIESMCIDREMFMYICEVKTGIKRLEIVSQQLINNMIESKK